MINVVGASSSSAPSPVPQQPTPVAPPTASPATIAPSTPTTPIATTATPPSNSQTATPHPISTTNPSSLIAKIKNQKQTTLLIAAAFLVVLLIGGIAALSLSKDNQDVRQQASGGPVPTLTPRPIQPTITNTPTTAPTLPPTPTVTPEIGTSSESNQLAMLNITTTPTATSSSASAITPTSTLVTTTTHCNESCNTDANCQNLSHTCYNGVCRLSDNPEDATCQLPSGGTQIALNPTQTQRVYTPEAQPTGDTPVTGPTDWLKYLQVGTGLLGLGMLALLFMHPLQGEN